MARSAFVEVSITNSTKLAQDSQDTADNAVKGITDLNDPNLMSVIEKQTAISQYAGLTSQYKVVLARAKDAYVSTTALTTAYNNLNTFMTPLLTDTAKASDVNRDTYKDLTDAYNMALSNIQNALKDAYNTDIANMQTSVSVASQAASSAAIVASQAAITGNNASQAAEQATFEAKQAQASGNNATSVANTASQAASNAVLVGSQAAVKADKAVSVANQAKTAGNNATSVANNASQAASNAILVANKASSSAILVGNQANSAIAVQSTATAKAQSAADNAFSQATTAIDTGKVTSQAVTDLKDGSKLTIADLENGLATKVANSEYASYKDQTASQIASKVNNGDFSTYKTQTADLISSKVATSDFSAYQATTAKAISSKVESSDFNTYKTQTADEISSKVESSNFQALQTQVQNSAVGTNLVTNSKFSGNSLADWVVDQGITTSFDSSGNLVLDVKAASGNRIYYAGSQLLVAGMTYAISFYAYVDSSSTNSSIVMKAGPYDNLTSIPVSGTTLTRYTGIIKPVWGGSGTLTIAIGAFNSGTVGDIVHITKIKLEKGNVATDWCPNPEEQASQSDITQAVNNIHLGFKNPDGSTFQMNLSADGVALMDFSKIILNGTTNIANGTIGTAQIADAAITNAKIANLAVGTAQIANGAITNAQIGSLAVDTANIKDAAISSAKIASLAVGTAQIGDGAITNAKIGKLAVGTAQIANAAITDAQVGNVSANKLTAGTIDFNTITGKNINASNITTGTLNTNRLNVGKLSALSANLGDVTTGSLKGVDIVAKTFSTPNGSFTTDASGAITAKNMTLMGGTLTSPTINASMINGSTINGTTFNAGTRLNSYGNTSYPLTINQDGSVTSTSFGNIANDPAALRTVMKDGMVKTNFRGMNKISNGIYSAADIAMGAGQLALFEGYTKSQDPNFTATGITPTGYVILDASTGLNLHGDNQQITFNGTSDDTTPKGITFTPYGNINATGTQGTWYIGNNSNMLTASFGIDNAGSRDITFYRELDVGNLHINTAHTFASADGQAINFAKGRGGLVDINANTVHYNSLSKLSLLSVKKDVKKVDTAYWAQLVNSIDLATYQYKSDDNTSHIRLSSIVDDVNKDKQWKLPDVFVTRDEEGELNGVDESVLLNATLATVQEQQKEIDKLNGHLLELEAKLNG
ncbi:beta strand repeat-containing protein [Lactiplantibacillus plantarum]|uniref:beta strand repeat-containing protein n=1 Tax=Lactiplantibacillus plantarum TaxID=1590 RepID=UPI003F53C1FE